MLVDESSEPGGSLLSEPAVVIDGKPAWEWLALTLAELAALPNVTILTRTTAIGYYHQNLVGLAQRLTDHLDTVPAGAPRERQLDAVFDPVARAVELALLHVVEREHSAASIHSHPEAGGAHDIGRAQVAEELDLLAGKIDRDPGGQPSKGIAAAGCALNPRGRRSRMKRVAIERNGFGRASAPKAR